MSHHLLDDVLDCSFKILYYLTFHYVIILFKRLSFRIVNCWVFRRSMRVRFKIKVLILGRISLICLQPLLPNPIHFPPFSTSMSRKTGLYRLYRRLPCLWLQGEFCKRRLPQEMGRKKDSDFLPKTPPSQRSAEGSHCDLVVMWPR